MLNIASGIIAAVIVLFSIWIAPKIIDLFGLPSILNELVKSLIAAIPWVFITVRKFLSEVVLKFDNSHRAPPRADRYVLWGIFTAAKLFVFGQLLSFLLALSLEILHSEMQPASPEFGREGLLIFNTIVWLPIILALSFRYGVALRHLNYRAARSIIIFAAFYTMLFGMDTTFGLLNKEANEMLKLQGWQLLARTFIQPLVLTLGMILGWGYTIAVGFLKRQRHQEPPPNKEEESVCPIVSGDPIVGKSV